MKKPRTEKQIIDRIRRDLKKQGFDYDKQNNFLFFLAYNLGYTHCKQDVFPKIKKIDMKYAIRVIRDGRVWYITDSEMPKDCRTVCKNVSDAKIFLTHIEAQKYIWFVKMSYSIRMWIVEFSDIHVITI